MYASETPGAVPNKPPGHRRLVFQSIRSRQGGWRKERSLTLMHLHSVASVAILASH